MTTGFQNMRFERREMTRLRQKYKKLKKEFERRPVHVIERRAEPPVKLGQVITMTAMEYNNIRGFGNLDEYLLDKAANALAKEMIKNGLVYMYKEELFGETNFQYQVRIVPPPRPIKCEPMGEC